MIRFEHVSVSYTDAAEPAINDADFRIGEGEFALVAGKTGTGKSTLLGAVNGHVPQFTGGTLAGRVTVAGLDTRDHAPRELAHIVGRVSQDPLAGFTCDTVEQELAYGMEQLGVDPRRMRTRVEETLDLLGVAELRARSLLSLSGGQQQRVAIGAAMASGARVLVLDEPTSALDPTSAEEVLAALLRLVHDLGVTVLIAEHRLERVAEYADRLLYLPGAGQVQTGVPAQLLATSDIAPPVVQLGQALGWQPIPVSVRDARLHAPALRERLSGVDPDGVPRFPGGHLGGSGKRPDPAALRSGEWWESREQRTKLSQNTTSASREESIRSGVRLRRKPAQDEVAEAGLRARGIEVSYGFVRAVAGVDLELPASQVSVLLGRNGSGKSSLLWALTGAGQLDGGSFSVGGRELAGAGVSEVRRHVRMVPQTAADLLYLDTVGAECAAADRSVGKPAGACRALLDSLSPGIPDSRNPRDLSEGQKLSLVLAIQLGGDPAVVLLDEPTRGLDYAAKDALCGIVRQLAESGCAVCVATHDVEFAAQVADRAIVMATGEVIAVGAAGEVLAPSAIFSPQVARVLSPQQWLTVAQVLAAVV
ncbi:MAG: ATP-binding cassette domain-containing protein [Propionibacteriaceae bacterium]|jgi:energy-coupling factor transport system ATP-binding protein|nr:ATP-binding cassette domain-containing protein [Propionibacteriaceae bacterium]